MARSRGVKFRACARAEIVAGDVVPVRLGRNEYNIPREGLVLLDASGTLRCFLNECKHLPIPLDGGSRDFLDDEGTHLFCGTHGARYRFEDGLCVEGPCEGDSLDQLELTIEDGIVYVVDTMDGETQTS